MRNKIILNEEEICKEYQETNIGIESMALKYHVGKLKIKDILKRNGIEFKSKGKQPLKDDFVVKDWKIEKYPDEEGYHYLAIDERTGFTTKDIHNLAGVLTTYIEKTYDQPAPTLYDRRLYYMRTGNYWWEQWFNVVKVKSREVKKCPYCEWTTSDTENLSGAFEVHLKKIHKMTKSEHLSVHPEDREYFRLKNLTADLQIESDPKKFVVCKVCGKKLAHISSSHLAKHNMTREEYMQSYGSDGTLSQDFLHFKQENMKKANMNYISNKVSSAETEIKEFIQSLGFECVNDRKILNGKEIDLYIPEKKIGFEYNGVIFHSEEYGKDRYYHINKTNEAMNKGVILCHIFEDDYRYHKEILFEKIRHMLGKSEGERIPGRKCSVERISLDAAKSFLDEYHIQGWSRSSVYLGAYYHEELVAVMSFIEREENYWELTRFASRQGYICQGVAGRLFSYFKRNFDYITIKTFAEIRWTPIFKDNLYTKLGFTKDKILKPDYKYVYCKMDRFKRYHKFMFRKDNMMKLGDFPDTMTESEMAHALGLLKVWDCGLIRYVYHNPEVPAPLLS